MGTYLFAVWIYTISIINYTHSRSGSCVKEITRDPGYQDCVGNYTMYRNWAMSPYVTMETNVNLTLLCSTHTRWFIGCLLSFIQHCPILLRDTLISEYSELRRFTELKDVDHYCHFHLGPCYGIQQCIDKIEYPPPSSYIPTYTPFSLMQDGIKTLCGPIKSALECCNEKCYQCKGYLNDSRKLVNETQLSFLSIVTSHQTYNVTKGFVLNDCPNLPKDFSTNNCVKSSVSTDGFVQCYEQVVAKYPTKTGKKSCAEYNAGFRCVAEHIGNKCGQEYTQAFVIVSPLFLSDVPVCPSVKPWPVSGNDDTKNRQPDRTVTGAPGIIPFTGVYPSSSCSKKETTIFKYAMCLYFVKFVMKFI